MMIRPKSQNNLQQKQPLQKRKVLVVAYLDQIAMTTMVVCLAIVRINHPRTPIAIIRKALVVAYLDQIATTTTMIFLAPQKIMTQNQKGLAVVAWQLHLRKQHKKKPCNAVIAMLALQEAGGVMMMMIRPKSQNNLQQKQPLQKRKVLVVAYLDQIAMTMMYLDMVVVIIKILDQHQ